MKKPRLNFVHGFDERTAYEAELKGYYGDVVVELPSGKQYRVRFYDAARIAQDLDREQKSGDICIAEPGIIIVPRVNRHYMEQAIFKSFENGYFEHLLPTAGGGVGRTLRHEPPLRMGRWSARCG
jgi:hypothetical protein